jgi:hypothetical protein
MDLGNSINKYSADKATITSGHFASSDFQVAGGICHQPCVHWQSSTFGGLENQELR